LVLVGTRLVPAWRPSWKRTLACATALTVSAVAVGAPYVAVTGRLTNKPSWDLVVPAARWKAEGRGQRAEEKWSSVLRLPSSRTLLAALPASWCPWFSKGEGGFGARFLWSVRAWCTEIVNGFHYIGWVPALLGLWWYRGRLGREPGAWVLLVLC